MVPATLVAVLLLSSTGCAAAISRQASNSPGASPSELAEAPSDSPSASSSPGTSPTPARSPSASPTPARSPSPGSSPTPPSSPTPAKLVITSLPFHVGEVGVAYTAAVMGARGGVPPYHWSISSGTFPTGLALSSGGSASGTPSAAGAFSFVVRVGDSAGAAAGAGGSITVARHLTVAGSCVTTPCSVERGCTTVCGAFGSRTGGVAPFTYVRSAGALPPGTSLSGLSLAGTFTTASKFSFRVTVTDSLGATGSVPANFSVFPHIAFSVKGGTCGPSYGCTVTLPFTMGTPGGTAKLSLSKVVCANPPCSGVAPEPKPNTLPGGGFSAVVARAGVVITFGSPGLYGDWVGSFYVTITDQSPCAPGPVLCSATVKVVVDTEAKYG